MKFFKNSGLHDDENHPIERKNQEGRRQGKKYAGLLSLSSYKGMDGFQIYNEGFVLGRNRSAHAYKQKER